MSVNTNSTRQFWIVGLAAALVLGIGFALIISYANGEQQKSLENWYDRMDLVAESRSSDLSAWLNRGLRDVEELSSNATLGMYAGEMINFGQSEQRGYTVNFLRSAAVRVGFHDASPLDQVAANVQRPRRAGLGVFTNQGQGLLQTAEMPALSATDLAPQMTKKASFIEFVVLDKLPVIIMATPIKVVDGMDEGDSPLWLVGARVLKNDFYDLLIQPGDSSETAENYLVKAGQTAGTVVPLSPLKDGGRLGQALPDAAASKVVSRPGAHGQAINYAGQPVLVTGKELTAPVPWVLVRTVTAAEALAELTEARNSLILNLSLTVVAILILMILVWRHGVSARLQTAYTEQHKLSEKNRRLSQFLQDVSDSLPAAIAAIDTEKRITFANKKLGDMAQLPAGELKGRRLETAFTADDAHTITPVLDSAFNGAAASKLMTMEAQDGSKAVLTMQVDGLPLTDSVEEEDQALLVLQDISLLVAAQKTAETNLRQLVSALTSIIDARDPWSKYHSSRVAEVAPAIALEMGLDGSEADTVRTAGQLMNLGKIFVPSEVLTKQGHLTESELALVRDSMEKGVDLLSGLEFGGPVEDALRQVREHVDGSGSPRGLSGDALIIEAKILSVANAFVGMVSSRAHRDGFSFTKALDILHKDAGTVFERRVVAALQNIIENKHGKKDWGHYGDKIEEL